MAYGKSNGHVLHDVQSSYWELITYCDAKIA